MLTDLWQKVYKDNPALALIVVLIVFLTVGSIPGVPLPGLSTDVFATEIYVDERIAVVQNSIAYKFSSLNKRDIEKEIFELKILKRAGPKVFTRLHELRLHEKAVELDKLNQQLEYYRTELKVNPNK